MRSRATARLFVAVDPPPAVSEELAAWARGVSASLRRQGGSGAASSGAGLASGAKMRLLAPETMHVTLCFLGSRPAGEMEMLATALEQCSLQAGELSLGAPLWLPPRSPRSLALEIRDGDGWLERVQRMVTEAFAHAVEWEPDRRRFRAHVTVARIGRGKPSWRSKTSRGRRGEQETAAAPETLLPPTPQLSFAPRAVVLYRSWLDPQGASYEAIATRVLAASSDSPSSSSTGEEGADGEGAP